ncbi:DUF945 family protein [Taylorella equigenitalis]|uniref:Uncharacterized protein n=1 Tax=Taylorella equigenitalis (strain MCE9) TaxID=937774 RepID=A0A654KGJ6_TAYEM|nr:DUF945 family protein [Taylorella equigenitalis]ADU91578.1 hypothetical protein TEQUI_0640 [Taylorella equigenitalis MCE9]WDU56370.1 YdgA family protein [Taylorella equigenitalis]
MNTKFQNSEQVPPVKKSRSNGWIKYLVILLLLIVIGIYPVASYLQGQKSTESIDKQLQNFNSLIKSYGVEGVSFSQKKADDGINVFSTDSIIEIQTPKGTFPLFDVHTEHGPLPFSEIKNGHLSPIKTKQVITLNKASDFYKAISSAFPNKDKEPLLIKYLHNYDNYIEGEMIVEKIYVNVNQQGSIQSEPAYIKFESDYDMNHLSSEFNQAKFLFDVVDKNDRFYYELTNLKANTKFEQLDLGKWNLEQVTQIDSQIQKFGNVELKLNKGDGRVVITHDPVNSRFYSLQNISDVLLQDRPFGSYKIEMDLDNLSSNAFKKLGNTLGTIFKEVVDLQKTKPNISNDELNDLVGKKHGGEFLDIVMSFLSSSPKLNYSINLQNASGKFDLSYGLETNPAPSPEALKGSSSMIFLSMLKNAYLKAQFNGYWLDDILKEAVQFWAMKNKKPGASEEHKKELSDLVHNLQKYWVQSGLMKAPEDAPSFSVTFFPNSSNIEKSEVNYNGEQITVPEFLARMQGSLVTLKMLLDQAHFEERIGTIFQSYGEVKNPIPQNEFKLP